MLSRRTVLDVRLECQWIVSTARHESISVPTGVSILLVGNGTHQVTKHLPDCCDCNDDYDACNGCHQAGKRCFDRTHELRQRQVTLNSDFTAHQHGSLYDGWVLGNGKMTQSDLLSTPLCGCNSCKSWIFQGTIFRQFRFYDPPGLAILTARRLQLRRWPI